jgi:hypothetical protein
MFSTLSADNFFEFLFCYFIEVTMMIGERLYFVPGTDSIKDDLVDYGERLYEQIIIFFNKN